MNRNLKKNYLQLPLKKSDRTILTKPQVPNVSNFSLIENKFPVLLIFIVQEKSLNSQVPVNKTKN